MITFKEKSSNRWMWDIVAGLESRVQAMIEKYPIEVADEFLEILQATAPDGIPGYPKSLKVQRFDVQGGDHVYGVVLPGYAHASRLKMGDAARTVLYVTSKARGRTQPDPATMVLARYNPWTMETLPFEPNRKLAAIMSRRVSEKEAKIIESMRKNDRRVQVDAELRDLGITIRRAHPVLLSRKVSRDLVFEILRHEYGVGGEPHVAHIRPGFRKLQSSVESRIWKRWEKLLVARNDRRWQRREKRKKGRPSFTRKVRPLQDLILAGEEFSGDR